MEIEIKKINYDKKGGRTRARVTYILPDGNKQRFEALGQGNREAKDNLIGKIEKECNKIIYSIKPGSNKTISEAVSDLIQERAEEYDHSKERVKRRPETIDRDRECFKTLIKPYDISAIYLDDIIVSDIDKYMEQLKRAKHGEKYYSSSTINRAMRLVKAVIDRHYKHSDKKSPAEAFVFMKTHTKPKTENDFLIGKEFEQFLSFLDDKTRYPKYRIDETYANMFIVIMYTGLRPGEAAGLLCKNWDSKHKILTIDHTGVYSDRTKTEESKAEIYPCDAAVTVLDACTQGKSPEAYIFPNTIGGILSLSNARRKFKKWLKECDINKDLHPHSMRGSYGTYLLDNGMEIEQVSHNLRHTKIYTTIKHYSTYTKSRRKADQEAANKIFDKLSN